ECVINRDDPNLLPLRPYEPDFGGADSFVDTRFDADVTSLKAVSATGVSGGGTCWPCPQVPRGGGCRPRKSPASIALREATTTTAPSRIRPREYAVPAAARYSRALSRSPPGR